MKWSIFDPENVHLFEEIKKEHNLSDEQLDKLKHEAVKAKQYFDELQNKGKQE